jgi:hypothetical protein
MDGDQELANRAEEEIGESKQTCIDRQFARPEREALWAAILRWVEHPAFLRGQGILRTTVLNELTFTTSHQELVDEGWDLIGKLAAKWNEEAQDSLKESLRISTFEVIAEAPEVPAQLEQLFLLARDPRTRWAVFAAYENCPWRLRPHAHKYSGGSVSDEECDQWFIDQFLGDDEILMKRPAR